MSVVQALGFESKVITSCAAAANKEANQLVLGETVYESLTGTLAWMTLMPYLRKMLER